MNKQICSIEIATGILELAYRIQIFEIEEIQKLFTVELSVGNIIFPSKHLNEKEVHKLLYNNLHSSICAFLVSIDEALEKAFGSKRLMEGSFLDNFRAIIYMFRCAFSHEISEPKWSINPKYRRRFKIEVPDECREVGIESFEFDFTNLNRENVPTSSFKGIAGLKTLSNIACKLLLEKNS